MTSPRRHAYAGTTLGKQDSRRGRRWCNKCAFSANVASDARCAAATKSANVQYLHFDGRQKFTAVPDQNSLLAEAAYYVHKAKFQPFARWETQRFVADVNHTKNINRMGGGVNYYIRGQNLKWTFQCLRALPQNGSPIRPSNEFTVQMQAFYF
jgi:hypothetical protein